MVWRADFVRFMTAVKISMVVPLRLAANVGDLDVFIRAPTHVSAQDEQVKQQNPVMNGSSHIR
jgi:hypothetical protein